MNLSRLIPEQKYTCNSYLRMLIQLLPVGAAWNKLKNTIPPYSPVWVELDTWQEDTFENYVISDCWNVIFKDAYRLYVVNGKFVAMPFDILYNNDYAKLTDTLTGDIKIEYGIMKVAFTEGGFISVTSVAGVRICDFGIVADTIILYDEDGIEIESILISYSQFQVVSFRIIRILDTLSFQYSTDSFHWSTFTHTIVYADSVYLRALITIDYTGFTYINCQATTGLLNKYYTPTSIFGVFLSCFAAELDRFEKYILKLIRETIPGTSVELLDRHEEIAGLPEVGLSVDNLTVEQRQMQVHAKMTNAKGEWTDDVEFLPLTKAHYIDYAASLGIVITITGTESKPFRFTTRIEPNVLQRFTRDDVEGIDHARLDNMGGMHTWTVNYISGNVDNWPIIKAVFDEKRPAHTIVNYVDP